ncbi:MAG: efflux RND transporter periplasmic adaptor subunit [Thermodesulfobacteriota bacterium]
MTCLKRLLPIVLPAILATLLSCSDREQNRPVPEVPVKTAAAVLKDMPDEITAVGTVEAYATVNITSRVDGQVVKIHIREGQEVAKDQLLIQIDERPYQAMLESALAALSRDRVRLEKAKKDAARYAELLKKDYVTRNQAEQAQADAEALEAVVKGGEAAAENARLNVFYCRITAPLNGRAGALLVDEGNLIKANETTRPLMTINQIQPIYVRFAVPEQRLPDFREWGADRELAVIARPAGKTEAVREGRLVFVDNAVDPKTGTIDLKAVFENRDSGLWPGQFVNVVLTVGARPQAVVVPSAAVQMGQQGNFVFAVKSDMTVEIRNITVAVQAGQETVIEDGLAAGEQVVTDGQLRLTPGARIVIKNGEAGQP